MACTGTTLPVMNYMHEYGWKCIIVLTFATSQRVDTESTYEVCKKNNNKELEGFLFLGVGRMLKSFLAFQCSDLVKCVRELQINNKHLFK